ncbi:unnamed protein product [Ilex paraguariensis]|uniref:CCT domain-containing protein n=1 Tax=Ilex paraguariensis TaxID=185542 RepID=A0ABC8SKY4_9AQUA
MASIPQYFSNEFYAFHNPMSGGNNGGGIAMWSEECLPPFSDNGILNVEPLEPHDIVPSISMSLFPERLGVSDMAVPSLMERNINMGSYGIAGPHGFECRYQHEVCDQFGDDSSSGVVPNFWPVYSVAVDNWGIQGKPAPEVEEPTLKIGKYSVEERKDRILRYLKKRNQRNFNKTIKYACRKTLADKRVRVRGRFAKNNEPCEDEVRMKMTDNPTEAKDFSYYADCVQNLQVPIFQEHPKFSFLQSGRH